MALFFKFRSRERDIETDVARVAPIFDEVETALRDAESELSGLGTRLGDQDDIRGKSRIRYLTEDAAALRRVKLLLNGILRPETPGGSER